MVEWFHVLKGRRSLSKRDAWYMAYNFSSLDTFYAYLRVLGDVRFNKVDVEF